MANPNPSPLTRFGAENGNPSGRGKSKGQRAAEIKSARIAAILRAKALSELLESVQAGEVKASDLITGDNLKLFKDSEDRAHGTPVAHVEAAVTQHEISAKPLDPGDWAAQHGADDS